MKKYLLIGAVAAVALYAIGRNTLKRTPLAPGSVNPYGYIQAGVATVKAKLSSVGGAA